MEALWTRFIPAIKKALELVESGAIGDIVRFGRPDDYVRTLRARLQSQTEAGVRQAAAQAFQLALLTWVIVGDLAKIEAPIRKLGLGSVQVLDADGNVLR
jgi:hypothetical protein